MTRRLKQVFPKIIRSKSARTSTKSPRKKPLEESPELLAISRSRVVIEFTIDGIITHANENFRALMEYSIDDVIGCHHSTFVDPSEAQSASPTAVRQIHDVIVSSQAQVGLLDQAGTSTPQARLKRAG